MVEALVKKLDPPQWCFEVGAGDGIRFSNTKVWRDRGWKAVLIEADAGEYEKLVAYQCYRVTCCKGSVGSIDAYLDAAKAPMDFGLGSIDIDGQDWWVWRDLKRDPWIMLVEFSPYVPEKGFIPPQHSDGHGGQNQAGFDAILNLGIAKGYVAVAKTFANLLFVRGDKL